MSTLAMVVAVLVLGLLFSAMFLWLCARLVRAGSPSYKRALACTFLLTVLGLPIQLLFSAIPRNDLTSSLVIAGIELLIGLLLLWTMLSQLLKITFPRSMLLSLPYLILSGAFATGLIVGLPKYVFAAYVIPTNSMAPTLIGWHHEAPCPNCQAVTIISGRAPDDDFPRSI